MSKNLISADTDFAAHLAAAFESAGFDPAKSLALIESSGVVVVDGREIAAKTAEGAVVSRPDGLPQGATVLLWVPAPARLLGRAPWATFVQGPRAILTAALAEAQLAPFKR